MTMPFGRYSGQELEELPSQYLSWLTKLTLYPPLSDAVTREVKRRAGESESERLVSYPAVHIKIPRAERQLAQRLVNLGHKVLARKLEADASADPALVERLNELAAIVKEQLAEVRA